jgi:hypothetical protein
MRSVEAMKLVQGPSCLRFLDRRVGQARKQEEEEEEEEGWKDRGNMYFFLPILVSTFR